MHPGEHMVATTAPEELEDLLEAERTRLADLLHDGPLADLFAVRQDLQEHEDPALDPAIEGLDAVVEQLRRLTRALHEDVHAGKPLAAALEAAAHAASGARRTTIDLDLRDTELLAPHAALVRSATLELTTNAVRHGSARRVLIATRRLPEDQGMEVLVAGDVPVIDPEHVARRGQEGHVGLQRLVRRVAAVGGSVAIGGVAQPSAVVLRLPLGAAACRRAGQDGDLGFHADPWCVVREDATYAQVSDAMTRLVGWSREEMLAIAPAERPWFESTGDARANRRRIVSGTLEHGHHVAHVTLVHRTGRRIPALGTSHLLSRRPDTRGPGFLALFRPLPQPRPAARTAV